MSAPLVLSLFPGVGLLDMAFEEEGFCVVRGPDLLWGGDVHTFHPPPGRFDGVIGGPPCQKWSRLALLARHAGYEVAPDLIPEFRRVVEEAAPAWFLMENVPAAPLPDVRGYHVQDQVLGNREHAGGESDRRRRFSFGWRMPLLSAGTVPLPRLAFDWWHPPQAATYLPPAVASGGDPGGVRPQHRKGRAALGYKTRAYLEKAIRAQGLPAVHRRGQDRSGRQRGAAAHGARRGASGQGRFGLGFGDEGGGVMALSHVTRIQSERLRLLLALGGAA